MTNEFNSTHRTLRYYEEIGLLHPSYTESGRRRYSHKDRTRLYLIQRGKNLGFHLQEIKEMIDLFTLDRTGEKQLQKTIEYGNQKILELDKDELDIYKNKISRFCINNSWERKVKELIKYINGVK